MIAAFTPYHRGGSGPPLVLLHGFMDTWRTWELVLPALERRHDVLALTLPGHAGGPPLEGEVTTRSLADAVERAMDEAGFETAHIVGNSLGGFVALQLAARGRARVGRRARAGRRLGRGRRVVQEILALQSAMHEQAKAAAPHADAIVATPEGRRRATRLITANFEHIPAELLAHLTARRRRLHGAPAADRVRACARATSSTPARSTCPVRIVWGTDDKLLPWPSTAARFRDDWLPHADWVELDGVGHCPQLDVPLETAQLILGLTSP